MQHIGIILWLHLKSDASLLNFERDISSMVTSQFRSSNIGYKVGYRHYEEAINNNLQSPLFIYNINCCI